MTGVLIFGLVTLPLAGYVGFCFGYYRGAKDEAWQMQKMYQTVNTTKQPGVL
jgi:hypothetical protein